MMIYRWMILLLVLVGCQQNNTQKAEPQKLEVSDPLGRLVEGNKRFVAGYPIHPDETPQRIRDLKKGQHPFAVVVSCSDSRIPPELIFDQGLGDIFTIRTAGNVIGDYELGSIEYAVEHLKCPLVVVLGHENCGAIQAFIQSSGEKPHHDHIEKILQYLADEPEEQDVATKIKKNPDLAVDANIRHGVHLLTESEPVLAELVKSGQIKVIGAYYDMDNGQVKFYDHTSEKISPKRSNTQAKLSESKKNIAF